MRLEFEHCPSATDEIAEAYLIGALTNEQAAAFEDHYVVCNSCATVLENSASYVDVMRAAVKTLRPKPVRAASGSAAY